SSSSSTSPLTTHIYTLSLHDALPIYGGADWPTTTPYSRRTCSCAVAVNWMVRSVNATGVRENLSINETTGPGVLGRRLQRFMARDRKSTRLNSSHVAISYAVFCLKKK